MATVSVRLPVGAKMPGGATEIAVEASTVGEALEAAIAREPGVRARVFREDGRMYAGVFLSGRNIKSLGGLEAPLSDGDSLQIVPPISGG